MTCPDRLGTNVSNNIKQSVCFFLCTQNRSIVINSYSAGTLDALATIADALDMPADGVQLRAQATKMRATMLARMGTDDAVSASRFLVSRENNHLPIQARDQGSLRKFSATVLLHS